MKNGLPRTRSRPGYDPAEQWTNRDPRMHATLTFPGDKYMGKVVANNRFSFTGYGAEEIQHLIRAPPKAVESLVGGQSETNFIVLRYADILLMYAEAQNEAAGPDATVYTARSDSIRSRPGMPFHYPRPHPGANARRDPPGKKDRAGR